MPDEAEKGSFWQSFRDFELTSLVERLASQNLDLQTAAERVIQSMAQRQVAASAGLPHIEGQSSSCACRKSDSAILVMKAAENRL
jgi:outer membrane protein TolC